MRIILCVIFFSTSCSIPPYGACSFKEQQGTCSESWETHLTKERCESIGGFYMWQGCPKDDVAYACYNKTDSTRTYLYKSWVAPQGISEEKYLKQHACEKY